MRTINCTRHLDAKEAAKLSGAQLQEDSYDVLIRNELVTVLKPEKSVLCVVIPRAVSKQLCEATYPYIRQAVALTANRGVAAGILPENQQHIHPEGYLRPIGKRLGRMRARPIKQDGTLSNTNYAKMEVESGIAGYYDRSSRFPYCRQTAFTETKPEVFAHCIPYFQRIATVFQAYMPERYAVQESWANATSADFMIPRTPFSTVTVNRNWPTAVHQDRGDLEEGFGVMSAIRAGTFTGCHFVFPAFRIGVDLQTGDVLLADVHEWHGNTPLVGIRTQYERISCVLYYRKRMIHCLSLQEELGRVKNRKAGDPLNVG